MPIGIPQALIDAGGWVFAAALAVGVIGAIIAGKLIPGGIHSREVERADKATAQLERMGEAQADLSSDLKLLIQILTGAVKLPPGGPS